jgi:hypothetical protein
VTDRQFELHLSEPGVVVASFRDLLVINWRGPSDLPTMRGVIGVLHKVMPRVKDTKIAHMTRITGANITLPDAQMRAAFDEARRFDASKKAEVLSLEVQGLIAAAVRSIATATAVAMPPKFPSKVTSNLKDAAAWLAPYMSPANGAPVDPRDLATVIENMR